MFSAIRTFRTFAFLICLNVLKASCLRFPFMLNRLFRWERELHVLRASPRRSVDGGGSRNNKLQLGLCWSWRDSLASSVFTNDTRCWSSWGGNWCPHLVYWFRQQVCVVLNLFRLHRSRGFEAPKLPVGPGTFVLSFLLFSSCAPSNIPRKSEFQLVWY